MDVSQQPYIYEKNLRQSKPKKLNIYVSQHRNINP